MNHGSQHPKAVLLLTTHVAVVGADTINQEEYYKFTGCIDGLTLVMSELQQVQSRSDLLTVTT